jgi:RHS repeat-associated protein
MLAVVPTHELRHPSPCEGKARERQARISRRVLQGSEQCFRVWIVVRDVWTATRTYSYDNSGNVVSDGTVTFAYNDAGRMVSSTKTGVTTTYALNALGQRVKKTTGGSSTYFVYDEAGHLVGEYDNAGTLIQETVWFGNAPVATLRPNGGSGVNLFYVHTDHLNTPRRISRPSDNVIVWRWDLDPFGTTVANEDPDGDSNLFVSNLRFPGQYFDAETGLQYNYYRDYDPATGRYVESDPIGLKGGTNT